MSDFIKKISHYCKMKDICVLIDLEKNKASFSKMGIDLIIPIERQSLFTIPYVNTFMDILKGAYED